MPQDETTVRGDILKWCRKQREITLRDFAKLTNSSQGYISEVENGKKVELSAKKIRAWAKALGVTEAFLRGLVPRYVADAVACKGLAAEVDQRIRGSYVREEWTQLDATERTRLVLSEVTRCSHLPSLILAWILGLELRSLEAYLNGHWTLPSAIILALHDLTTLPLTFFQDGELEQATEPLEAEYMLILYEARRRGISAQQLKDIIDGME